MILITGAAGQLGTDVASELEKRNIEYIGIDMIDKTGEPVPIASSPCATDYKLRHLRNASVSPCLELDITDAKAVYDFIVNKKPQCVIHCAAYTVVDNAEDEQEKCFKVNAEGTENIAKACKEINAEMIYISTDYVFNGEGDEPYETDAVKGPISVYGKSKLAGEEAVLRHLEKFYIVRISWVFGKHGNNFVKTMMKLAETRNELNVVSDQVGSPTYTPDLAVLLCDMVLSGKYGTYHATNEGFCSWAEFADEIMKQSGRDCIINPIPTEQYPTKATRPKNSRLSKASLDNAGFSQLPDWKNALKRYIRKD